jgi:hypothetical protein
MARRRASANIAWSSGHVAKRLPSRRWEQIRLIKVLTIFDDEDDSEIAHSLEGSRFGPCPATLAIFVSTLIPPKTDENRRLPGTSQRDVFTHGLGFVRIRRIELHRAGLFPGAACCDILWPDGALVRISRGRPVTWQSGSPPDAGNKYASSTC